MSVAGGEQAGAAGLGGPGERSSAHGTGRHGQGTCSAMDTGLAGGGGLSCPHAPMGCWAGVTGSPATANPLQIQQDLLQRLLASPGNSS